MLKTQRCHIIMLFSISLWIYFTAPACETNNHNHEQDSSPEHLHENEHDHSESGHSIVMNEQTLNELDIELSKADQGLIEKHIDLTGEIVIDPGRLAHIIPRFSGIVKEVNISIGDRVTRNTKLAVIESNESLTDYTVESLIEGTVIDMHLTQGEMVSGDEHAFVIADISNVWADLYIYQKDLHVIKVGQRATITTGYRQQGVTGTITYTSPVLDEQSRTMVARVVLNNDTGIWKPGTFIQASVITGRYSANLAVTNDALYSLDNQTVVFVRHGDELIARQVITGKSDKDMTEIIDGLKAGEQYVSKGGFILKAEIEKESFGGHVH
ncbi:HlyD family efflux transporter periplasmic adaptor subunit [candidate division KSB1 bacterium]|nr:HlyD family efflux transporter periplasmic adaptor subunit [candidate division KSB1 bacterium]